jgi:hypothetical protein
MNDLLHLVRDAQPSGNSSQTTQRAFSGGQDVEMGYTSAVTRASGTDGDAELAAFFAKAKDVQTGMHAVHAKQRDLLAMHEQGKAIVRMRDITEHRAKMQVRPDLMPVVLHPHTAVFCQSRYIPAHSFVQCAMDAHTAASNTVRRPLQTR